MTPKTVPNQTNSHILVHEFDYYAPATLEEAITLLKKYHDRAALIAGGTHLLAMMKMERETPEVLININNLSELKTLIQNQEGELVIGAGVSIYTLRQHPLINNRYPVLAQACRSFGSTQIQIMATLGGNLCNGSPASDTVPALSIYDAHLVLQGPAGRRQVPLKHFLLAPGMVDLQPGEILVSIILPPPPANSLGIYIKVSRVAADLAKASMALLLVKHGSQIDSSRVAFGSVAPTVVRLARVEEFLQGKVYSDELAFQAGEMASMEVSPIDDTRSTAWYRRELVKVMVYDGLRDLIDRDPPQRVEYRPEMPPAPEKVRPSVQVAASSLKEITLTINGVRRRLLVAPNELLIHVLREKLQLTGSKYGCGLGECGACTVHLHGKAVLSCLLLAVSLDEEEISTVEGLQDKNGTLDPLQEAFIDHGAFQCGYCTPGILMTLKSLLAENPVPGEEEVRDYLKGNRCRCTGYISIARATMSYIESQKSHSQST